MHLHGNPDKDFEGIVTDAGKKALVSADWGSNDFAKISRWIDDKKNVSPPVVKEILLPGEVFQKYGGKHMTISHSKKINSIIIFNPNKEYPYEIEFKFDKPTQSAELHAKVKNLPLRVATIHSR